MLPVVCHDLLTLRLVEQHSHTEAKCIGSVQDRRVHLDELHCTSDSKADQTALTLRTVALS